MRKIVLQEFVSLDGMAAGPNDTVDFIPASTQADASFGREQSALNGHGRHTPARPGHVRDVRRLLAKRDRRYRGRERVRGQVRRAVEGHHFERPRTRAVGQVDGGRIVKRGPVEEVARLKQQRGKDILISGSILLAQALMEADAIDEYRLVLCPFVLGRGR